MNLPPESPTLDPPPRRTVALSSKLPLLLSHSHKNCFTHTHSLSLLHLSACLWEVKKKQKIAVVVVGVFQGTSRQSFDSLSFVFLMLPYHARYKPGHNPMETMKGQGLSVSVTGENHDRLKFSFRCFVSLFASVSFASSKKKSIGTNNSFGTL